MDKISVIVPVYNVEQYVGKCLDSLINQTYTNLEILCVDDGSTDASGAICDQYAKKDGRIRVIHQANKGVRFARVTALKQFTGHYCGFVDPDDWVEPEMYEILYRAAQENNAAISAVNYFVDTDTGSTVMSNSEKIPGGSLTATELLKYTFDRNTYKSIGVCLWNKLYSSDIIDNANILFDDTFKYGGDALFYISCALHRRCTGVYVDKPLYHYYQRTSSYTNYNSLEWMNDFFIFLNTTINLMIEQSGYEEIIKYVKKQACYSASLFCEAALANNNRQLFKAAQNEMRLYRNEYIELNQDYPERIERINNLLALPKK